VFEAILCFDEWLRKDTYWADHNAEGTKAIVSLLITKIMHSSKQYIPTSKSTAWNYPNFHELMHIVDDMSRFGVPQIFLCPTTRMVAHRCSLAIRPVCSKLPQRSGL
jgi:hypothetical protein